MVRGAARPPEPSRRNSPKSEGAHAWWPRPEAPSCSVLRKISGITLSLDTPRDRFAVYSAREETWFELSIFVFHCFERAAHERPFLLDFLYPVASPAE